MKRLGLYVSVATICVAWANQAMAQEAMSGAVKKSEGEGIEEIIVTAQRREESAQRSALSIQAVTGADLVSKGVFRQEDLNAIAPGVALATGGNYPQTYIRGVGNPGTNSLTEAAVAANFDGVYIGRPWASRGAFFDLDRVEILKGPQGTLYGRNASGGALNLISVRPKLGEFSGFGEVEVGNYALKRFAGAVNVPLSEVVAARISGQVVDRDGYLSGGADDDKTQAVRGQILIKPTDQFSVLLRGVYQHAGGKGAGAVVLDPTIPGDKWRQNNDPAIAAIYAAEPFLGPILALPSQTNYLRINSYELAGELNWNFGPATLTILPSYRHSDLRDAHSIPGFPALDNERAKQTSLEARLSNNGSRLKWVVGGYFFREHQQEFKNGVPATLIFLGPQSIMNSPFDAKLKSEAIFGQATYSVTDNLRLTGGLRYTHETKNIDLLSSAYSLPNPPAGLCSPPYQITSAPISPGQSCLFVFRQRDEQNFNNVSWKLGAEYDLGANSLAYFNASTGFKSGGFYYAPPPAGRFGAEKLLAFNLGVKNRFLNNKLQVNAEAFHWIYKDQQVNSIAILNNGYVTQITLNAGNARITGGDLDLIYRATKSDTISTKIEYIHSNYSEFTFPQPLPADIGCPVDTATAPPTVDCSGRPLVRTPKWSGTVDYTHIFELGSVGTLDATISTQFASRSFTGFDYLPDEVQKSYSIWNASLTYRTLGGGIAVTAYARNIGNEAVVTQSYKHLLISGANPLAGPNGLISGSLRPPRTYGIILHADF